MRRRAPQHHSAWTAWSLAIAFLLVVAVGVNPAFADTVPPEPPADELPVEPTPIGPQMPAGDNYPPPDYSAPAQPLPPPPVNPPADLVNLARPAEVDAARAARDAQFFSRSGSTAVTGGLEVAATSGAEEAAVAPVAQVPDQGFAAQRFAAFLAFVRGLLFGQKGAPVGPVPGHLPMAV